MSGYPGGHAGLLAIALATHALVGYAVGRVVGDEPIYGAVGGLAADVDLLVPAAAGWPLAHRGVTHTPVAAVAGAGLAYALTRRRPVATAVGAGYASQLLIDLTTPRGIALAYPLSRASVAVPLGGHGPAATALLWLASAATLRLARSDDPVPGPLSRLRSRDRDGSG